MDRLKIRRRRRVLLAIAGSLLGVGLLLGVVFGRRWRREVILRALASGNEAKVAWATRRLKKQPDQGVGLLLGQVGRRGERFDVRVADYLEEISQADRLPVELRVGAALEKLADPLRATVGFARLLELPADGLAPLLKQAVSLEGLALHRAAMACVELDAEASRDQANLLLEQDGPRAWRLGLALLGALGEEEGIESIRAGLSNPDPSVRAEAVRSLARVRGRQCRDDLAHQLGDPSEVVRLAVLAAAVKVFKAEDGALLQPALTDKAESVRAQAALVLASLGAGQQAEAIGSLVADPSPRVREAVAVALAALDGDRALEMHLTLSRDESPDVRRAAAAALAERCDHDRARAALFRLAGDDSLEVARAAYGALAGSPQPEVLSFFILELTNDRPSWALDPLAPETAGASPKPVPFGALACCALRWLTGKEFGYHWRASGQTRREAQQRWQDWVARTGPEIDLSRTPRPEGVVNYEQLLRRMPRPAERP